MEKTKVKVFYGMIRDLHEIARLTGINSDEIAQLTEMTKESFLANSAQFQIGPCVLKSDYDVLEAENAEFIEDLHSLLDVAGVAKTDSGVNLSVESRVKAILDENAALREQIAKLKAEARESEQQYEAVRAKFEGCPHNHACEEHDENGLCGCSFDHKDHVCAYHAPQLKKALEDAAALHEQLRAMQEPVSHDEVIAVHGTSGHSLQAMTYAAICSGIIAARARKACA